MAKFLKNEATQSYKATLKSGGKSKWNGLYATESKRKSYQ